MYVYTITKEEFISGWVSGVIGITIGHPIETIKVRTQVNNISILQAIKQSYQYAGIFGFYKGLSLPLLTAGILNAVFFGVYGNVLRLLEYKHAPDPENPKWVLNVFHAGCWGGTAQVITANPIEVIKIRFQSDTVVKGAAPKKQHKGLVAKLFLLYQATYNIFISEGIKGFYRGFTVTVIRDVPTFGLYMWTFVALDKWMSARDFNYIVKYSIAGGMAGIMSWIFVVPFDVVKSRLQTDDPLNPKFNGTMDCFKKTYQEGGIRMLFKGTTMLVIRAFLVNAAIFLTYQQTMSYLQGKEATQQSVNKFKNIIID